LVTQKQVRNERVGCFQVRTGLTASVVARDLLPALATILSPALRPVPRQMLNAQEQKDMAQLVSV
jgi:hypothetical protein